MLCRSFSQESLPGVAGYPMGDAEVERWATGSGAAKAESGLGMRRTGMSAADVTEGQR